MRIEPLANDINTPRQPSPLEYFAAFSLKGGENFLRHLCCFLPVLPTALFCRVFTKGRAETHAAKAYRAFIHSGSCRWLAAAALILRGWRRSLLHLCCPVPKPNTCVSLLHRKWLVCIIKFRGPAWRLVLVQSLWVNTFWLFLMHKVCYKNNGYSKILNTWIGSMKALTLCLITENSCEDPVGVATGCPGSVKAVSVNPLLPLAVWQASQTVQRLLADLP